MRPIKFREWIQEPGHRDIPSRMCEPDFQGNINHVFAQNGKCINGTKYFYMQYTGFKDETDQEIYEGDILLEISLGNMVIEWEPEIGSWVYRDINSPVRLSDDWVKAFRVIGNIYENPELIVGG